MACVAWCAIGHSEFKNRVSVVVVVSTEQTNKQNKKRKKEM